MGLVEAEGLVLRSYGLAEADKIVVFLTREHGLVRGVAKGAKRLKSKFGSSLEPCSIVRFTYFQKEERELVSIQQSDLVRSFFSDAPNPEFFPKFSYIVELLSDFAPPSDPNERLYGMAKICLETASDNPRQLSQIVFYFEIWLLKLGGYLPDWSLCGICRRAIGADENTTLMFNFQLGCQICRRSNSARRVTPEECELFALAQKVSPKKFLEATTNRSEDIQSLSALMRQIISHVLGRDKTGEGILLTGIIS